LPDLPQGAFRSVQFIRGSQERASMSNDEQVLSTLREIRDGQKEVISSLAAQHALAEEQLKRWRATVDDSIGLQREALKRQRTITVVAMPTLIACIVAIAYLVLRYF
jgi:hypothetical protein